MKPLANNKLLAALAGIAAFAAVACLCAEFFLKQQMVKRSQNNRYEIVAQDAAGRRFLLLCYEGGISGGSDFVLNYVASSFKSLEVQNGRHIDTRNPLQCVKYPADLFEAEQRLARAGPKKAGEKRIVFIGDSFTFGEGARHGAGFPEVMDRMLQWQGNPHNWKALNLGRAGVDILQIYNVLFKTALNAQPDKIVYVWSADDIPQPARADGAPAENRLVYRPRHPGPGHGSAIASYLKTDREEKAGVERDVKQLRDAYLGKKGGANTAILLEYLRMMKAEANKAGAEFEIAIFPLIAGGDGKYPLIDVNIWMLKKARENGVGVIDLTGDVLDRPAGELSVSAIDLHPNDAARFNAAAALFNKLELSPNKISKEDNRNRASKEEPPEGEQNFYVHKGGALSVFLFFYVLAAFAALTISAGAVAPELLRLASKENARAIFILLLIACGAFALRAFYSAHIHMSFADELNREVIAREWLRGRFDARTLDDIPGAIIPFFLAFKIFGLTPAVGYWLSAAINTLSVFLIYAVARMTWKDARAALIAALLLAVCPVNLRFAGSQATDTHSMFFLLLCAFAVILDMRRSCARTRLFLVAACSFALFVRTENFVFILMLYSYRALWPLFYNLGPDGARRPILPALSEKLKSPAFVLIAAFALAGLAVFFAFFIVCVTTTPQASHITGIGANVKRNLPGNVDFFIRNNALPVFTTIFAAAGIYLFSRSAEKEDNPGASFFLAAWLVVVFLTQLTSAAGGYDMRIFKDTVRYANNLLPPLLAFAGLGLSRVISAIPGKAPQAAFSGGAFAYIIALPFLFNPFISLKTDLTEVNETLNSAVLEYPADMTYYTNSEILFDIIALDMRRNAVFIQDNGRPPDRCADGQKCLFVFFQLGKSMEINNLSLNCYGKYTFKAIDMLICPLSEAAKIPDAILKQPEESALKYNPRGL